jgi:hypothetical protein
MTSRKTDKNTYNTFKRKSTAALQVTQLVENLTIACRKSYNNINFKAT